MIGSSIPKRIEKILFALLSPNEIRKMSSTKIITADTYDDDGFPIDMGLMDPRLGVIEPGLRCNTCGRKVDECPGHFGHIDLAMPVIHVGFVKLIKNLLLSSCLVCGRILLTVNQVDESKEKMDIIGNIDVVNYQMEAFLSGVLKTCKDVKVCPHCGEEQKKITLDKPTTFREEGHKLTPKEVRERLEKIIDEDLSFLGINYHVARPEWMILTALPVPPVTVRPSITLESGDRSEDDLTHKLVDILRINQRLQENRDAGAPQLIVEDLWELLQYHVTTYFDNQTSGVPPARHRSGRPLKTLAQRLKGKEGRFRSNLSGKRVNFSARTVISPDPLISLDEVGVPKEIARELTLPMRVFEYNLEEAKRLVLNGPDIYPGVNYIIRSDGHRVKVTDKNTEMLAEKLEDGWVIERHVVNGDIVLFNRQPSLHRMSMMAHDVRVMSGKTFRLNLAVCPPYNADFDGDEMNLHCIQGEEARAEAKIIMGVAEHILSPRFGGPIIGAIHDHVTGIFMLTHKWTKFTLEEAIRILFLTGHSTKLMDTPPDLEENGVEYYYGKSLFSLIMPDDLNMEYSASVCQNCPTCLKDSPEGCAFDAHVVVKQGKLLKGTIDGRSVGAFKGAMLERVVRDYGTEVGKEFLNSVARLAVMSITMMGFSTGIDEEDIPPDAKKQIGEKLNKAEKKVHKLVESYNTGNLSQLPGRSLRETLEVESMRILGGARDEAGMIAGKYLGLANSAVMMAKSGARGSMLNLSQMAGSIGQQAVRGERINRGYQDRTLPHFEWNDLGAPAKGFVKSSYKSGLSPTEYFFHSMGGREGLVDTAVRTSRSGYMQRRLINALEDLKVHKDRSVRNTAGTIIQFKYGEDGIDPAKSEQGEPVNYDDIIARVVRERDKGKKKKGVKKK
jgi:DNA-directed RNA polymerase subunit A'